MALKDKGKTYRNLEEQVAYLSEFHNVEKALASWGIKIVGQLTTATELPIPYDGDYGDAYAVGTEAPFDFYIWTRAAVAGGEAYWFPFGKISIVGPQGPQGPKGDKGDTGASTQWYTAGNKPANPNTGDLFLAANGDIQRYSGPVFRWITIGNIKGPQGLQGIQGNQGPRGLTGERGPQGERGPATGFITIVGKLDNADQLPTPESLNDPTYAYLVLHDADGDNANDHYHLYVQIGTTPENREWDDAGPFNAATLVIVNGAGVNVFDADTKVNKIPGTGSIILYGRSSTGEETSYIVASSDTALQSQRIPYYRSTETTGKNTTIGGEYTIAVGTPKQPYAAANKKYVDDNKIYKYEVTFYDITQEEVEQDIVSNNLTTIIYTTISPENISLNALIEKGRNPLSPDFSFFYINELGIYYYYDMDLGGGLMNVKVDYLDTIGDGTSINMLDLSDPQNGFNFLVQYASFTPLAL